MAKREAKNAYLEEIRRDPSSRSFITRYLAHHSENHPREVESLQADLMETFTSDSGLRVLKLMEKSVLFVGIPDGSSESALRELNAVRNFVLEIRRLVANG